MLSDETRVLVLKFWEWFSRIVGALGQDFSNRALLDELDARVASLGPVSWEIGPGLERPNLLVITPDGDPEYLRLSKDIVDLAPSILDWEVHPAKPPKQLEHLNFSFTIAGRVEKINADNWGYLLSQYPDYYFDIVVVAPSLRSIPQKFHGVAVKTVLDSILGEALRLEHIYDIDVVTDESSIPERQPNNIRALREHLVSELRRGGITA